MLQFLQTLNLFRAISSERLIIFETLPGAGSNSFKVTTGPFLFLPVSKSRVFSRVSSFTFISDELSLSFFLGF